jgi:hypothetical protein
VNVLFDFLTTPEGILEHLQAYILKEPGMSDPEHYRTLCRGVTHVIEALQKHLADEGTEQ